MRYWFVKRYNPAYDPFLIRYFREGGIDFDENTTFDEADRRELFSIGLNSMTVRERLFCSYVKSWRMHPECRPSLYYLFQKTLGSAGIPNLQRLRGLESQLPPGQGKLLFTKEEAAADISDFHRKYLTIPLKQEIEQGGVGKELSKYFSSKEVVLMPSLRMISQEKFDESVHTIAGELLERLGTITPEKVARDIDSVLEGHEKTPDHMKLTGKITNPKESQWVCMHGSEYVELHVYQSAVDESAEMFLTSARGLHASDHVSEPGWDEIVFPWYEMLKAELQAD